jgi:RNA polymerase sigma-70 factor (ECF subfamily)
MAAHAAILLATDRPSEQHPIGQPAMGAGSSRALAPPCEPARYAGRGGEEDALVRCAQADREAFRALVERYTPLVRHIARSRLADRGAAEDAAQEAWLDAWRGLPRFQPGWPFRPWLRTLVINRCRMASRRRAVPAVPLEEAVVDALGDSDAVAERQRRLEVDAELQLPEIAAFTGTPVGTVKSRLHRGLGALRERLARERVVPVEEGLRHGGLRHGW